MNKLRIPKNKVEYDPKTGEYLIDNPLEKIGTFMDCSIFLDKTVFDYYYIKMCFMKELFNG